MEVIKLIIGVGVLLFILFVVIGLPVLGGMLNINLLKDFWLPNSPGRYSKRTIYIFLLIIGIAIFIWLITSVFSLF